MYFLLIYFIVSLIDYYYFYKSTKKTGLGSEISDIIKMLILLFVFINKFTIQKIYKSNNFRLFKLRVLVLLKKKIRVLVKLASFVDKYHKNKPHIQLCITIKKYRKLYDIN